jgi:hypothetical protein
MSIELEIDTYHLSFQTEELDTCHIIQRYSSLLASEDQTNFVSYNLKKHQGIIEKYHDKNDKDKTLKVG